MHLKSLDINGFKSFALPTHLEFTPGVTAIVGPNGSGKSNVADGVRWVLGEMSIKTLRGKKSEDVIFAGSHARAAHSLAEITMTFDNADGKIPFDAAEVAITRRLFRNGESEYEINGTQVRLMDINELLSKSGLGERSYAVIGQGQVDEILRASPAERKEFFEEAAGVKQFQNKKESALRKLETTRRNLIRVEDLVREIRPRLNSLKRQAERAQLREVLEKELRSASLAWFGAELAAIDQAAQTDLAAVEKIQTQRTSLEQTLAGLEKSHGAAELDRATAQQKSTDERIHQTRQNLAELEARRNEIRRKQASLQEKDLPVNLSALPSDIAEREARLNELTRRASTLVPQVESLRKSVAQAEKAEQASSAESQKLRNALTTSTQRRGSLDQAELSKIVKDLRTSFDRLFEALSTLKEPSQVSNALSLARQPREQLDVLFAKVQRAEPVDVAKINAQLDKVLEIRDKALADLAGFREQLATKETEHKFLSREVEATTLQLIQLKKQLAGAKKSGAAGAKQAALDGLASELKGLEQSIATEDEQLKSLEREMQETIETIDDIREQNRSQEDRVVALRKELASVVDQQSQLNVAKGKYDVRREDLLKETREFLGQESAQTISRGGADALTPDKRVTLKNKIDQLRKKVEMAGGVDETIMTEFKQTNERFEFLTNQAKDLSDASDKLRELIQQLDHKIHQLFATSLEAINREFDKAFKVLFNGGTSKLVPVRAQRKKSVSGDAEANQQDQQEEEQALSAEDEVTREVERLRASDGIVGVDIKATPPGKKLQTVGMLSGGEKALTSIALLSAILANKPSPFVILDEVDAALDEANSRRFAKIVKSLASKTQFITITHNRETMRQAAILYGVTMQKDGVSKLLSVKLDAVNQSGAITAPTSA
jgi:chromosome segregation protein